MPMLILNLLMPHLNLLMPHLNLLMHHVSLLMHHLSLLMPHLNLLMHHLSLLMPHLNLLIPMLILNLLMPHLNQLLILSLLMLINLLMPRIFLLITIYYNWSNLMTRAKSSNLLTVSMSMKSWECAVLNIFEIGKFNMFKKMNKLRMKQAFLRTAAVERFDFLKLLPRGEPFSPFIRSHRKLAMMLVDIFKEKRRSSELRDFCVGIRDHVNEQLFVYALTYVILHKKEFRKMFLPSMVEVFPQKFFPYKALKRLHVAIDCYVMDPPYVLHCLAIICCSMGDPEARLNYWREDHGLSCHYWFWNVAHPIGEDTKEIDRKGELFYYMHQQMVARYDCERLSTSLECVLPLDPCTWTDPIPEGYDSQLSMNNLKRMYPPREKNTILSNVSDPESEVELDIGMMTCWANRLYEMVNTMPLSDDKEEDPDNSRPSMSTRKRSVEIIADAICSEQPHLWNLPYSGCLNLAGHTMIAYSQSRRQSDNFPGVSNLRPEMGVMMDPFTAVRDPLFFRWYKFIDTLFQAYNERKLPYTVNELAFPGIILQHIGVCRDDDILGFVENDLETGWSVKDFDIDRGILFDTQGPVDAWQNHIDYKPFSYELRVLNEWPKPMMATVRIFIAPRHNKLGHTMSFEEQRGLWIEMDKFTTPLTPGVNEVSRSSLDSSVTCNRNFTFVDMEKGKPHERCFDYDAYSGCGWPQNLLVPRGYPEGKTFLLFVMLTNWEEDSVHETPQNSIFDNEKSGVQDIEFIKEEKTRLIKKGWVIEDLENEGKNKVDNKGKSAQSMEECIDNEVDADSDDQILKGQYRKRETHSLGENVMEECEMQLKRKDRSQHKRCTTKKLKEDENQNKDNDKKEEHEWKQTNDDNEEENRNEETNRPKEHKWKEMDENEDGNEDSEDSDQPKERQWKRTDCSVSSASYCGLRDSKYPDKRPMGFPFDRKPTLNIHNQSIRSYVDYAVLDNVMIQDIEINFRGRSIKFP